MTSLAVLPPLKRSITDIMDEELYHVPNSPIQFNTRTNATQNQTMTNMTILQQQSPKLQSQQIQQQMQRSDSPAGAYANNNTNSLFFQSNGSNTMLPSVFNTNDTFFEQYVYNTANNSTNMTNNTWSTGSFGNASISSLNDSIHNNSNTGMDIDESYSNSNAAQSNSTVTSPLINTAMSLFPPAVKPFTEYGNPDSFIRPQQLQNRQMSPPPAPLPQSFPARPNRRRRLTTLDEGDAHNNSKKKEEDYLLFNPNIQPSHLIDNNTNFFNDEFLFVPQKQQQQYETNDGSNTQNYSDAANNSTGGFVPGYENDYLLIEEDFDEEIEADLSEDEEDDEDKYFHVDEEFDQLVMNNNYNDEEFNNLDMMDMDEYLRSGSTNNNGNIVNTNNYNDVTASNIKLDKHDIMNGGFIDVKQDKIDETHNSISNVNNDQKNTNYNNIATNDEEEEEEQDLVEEQDLLDNDDNFSPYSMDTPPARKQSRSLEPQPHHKSAAEISLNNPNHQCDLINPATGLPCNKPFSRPYDLIRHQETIHASKKKIFRCVICEGRVNGGPGNGKLKTFSRGDALSRHIKVKHGLVGKEALDIINEAKENVEYVSV